MEHKPQDYHTQRKPYQNSAKESVPLIRKLEWDLWANSGWAVLGLVWAMFFLTPIFDFFGESMKIYSVTLGICGVFTVGAFVFAHSFVLHREGRSAAHLEAQAEEDKKKMQERINHLESDLSELRLELKDARRQLKEQEMRSLSDEQRQEILTALSRFAGQKASVQCVMYDTDGIRYGQQFVLLLRTAKWNISQLTQSGDFNEFDNVLIEVSPKDGITDCLIATLNVFAKLGIIRDPNQIGTNKNISAGDILINIRMKPLALPKPYIGPPVVVNPQPGTMFIRDLTPSLSDTAPTTKLQDDRC